MTLDLSFTEAEGRELEEILRLTMSGSANASFRSLLRRWSDLVAQVDAGYDDSIYEYTNDLAVRDRLDQVLSFATGGLQTKIRAAIQPADELFARTTSVARKPLRPESEERWWWERIPRRLSGELQSDLESRGLV